MNLSEVLHLVGGLLVCTAAAMLPPTLFAWPEGLLVPWLAAMGATALGGCLLWWLTPRRILINEREGAAVVSLGWLAVVTAGALPFLFTGVLSSPAAALFESVSGFTTTGASVFPMMETLPRSILLWRSVTHWLGGMGIIVLGVAILPLLGMGGAQLFRAEAPGITNDRLTPRIASTARLLWGVYLLLTGVLTLLYVLLGMDLFDAVNHAMSCLATGGFSTRTASMGAFSAPIQWVTVVFMVMAGTNFMLHYRILTGEPTAWLRDEEWRWYVGVMAVAVLGVFVALGVERGRWGGEILTQAAFNVASIQSTTGFASADFAAWPSVTHVILLGLMFIGAMGGSTGGGLKAVRLGVVCKYTAGEIRKILHPRAVLVTKFGGRPVRPDVLHNVLAFLALYVLTHGVGTLLLAAMGSDLVTSLGAALAAMSSIGPGLGAVGPASHYGDLTAGAHVVLSLLMLLGRLEFYTLLVLIIPGAWARWGGRR